MSQKLFAIILTRGEHWKDGVPLEEQEIGPHRDYLKDLAERDVVVAAGPFRTSDGGLIIIHAGDADEAGKLMREDPAVRDGLFAGDVQQWAVVIDHRGRLAN